MRVIHYARPTQFHITIHSSMQAASRLESAYAHIMRMPAEHVVTRPGFRSGNERDIVGLYKGLIEV